MARAASSLVVPRVLAARGPQGDLPGFILLEHLEPGPPDDERLGRGLAELHRQAAPRFGFPVDSYCGSTRQPNAWCGSWPEFYAERRLRPLLSAIAGRRGLSRDERRVYDGLLARLPGLLGAGHRPSLVHGDLWSGNVLHSTRGPALVDPACAFAEREVELGLSTLFGGLSERALAAYQEAWPLPAGWRERNPLYQLYHLLNHQLLFGGGYGAQALEVARRFA
jgi:fructosamine-3-kinase